MALTFQPGSAVTVLVTTGDTTIGPTAATYDSDIGPAQLTKPLLGAKSQRALAGQVQGTFTLTGHTTEENIADLAALRDPANQPFLVDVTFNPSGDKEAYQGVGTVTISAAGDGEVDWTITGTVDGDYTFTPGI